MTTIPPAYETLFPDGPLLDRAQRLTFTHKSGSHSAWIARTGTSDLLGRLPESYLGASELTTAATFRFAARRETYLLGRLAAKAAAGPYMAESDWTRIELSHGVFGQPLVNHPVHCNVDVSLSHSGGQAIAIAGPREYPMAVDVELVDRDRADTVKKALLFRPEERQWIQSAAVEETAAYVLLWTVREALGKLLRCGITCPLELLSADKIQPLGEGVWASGYHNFQRLKCLSWVRADRIFSLAMPRDMDLTAVSRRNESHESLPPRDPQE